MCPAPLSSLAASPATFSLPVGVTVSLRFSHPPAAAGTSKAPQRLPAGSAESQAENDRPACRCSLAARSSSWRLCKFPTRELRDRRALDLQSTRHSPVSLGWDATSPELVAARGR